MAIRELFARFEFAWNQGVLKQITAASQRAEARVQKLGKTFNRASVEAANASTPMRAWAASAAKTANATASIRQAVGRLAGRLAGLRVAWSRTFAANPVLRPSTHLNRLGLMIGRVVNRLREASVAWRTSFRGGSVAQAQVQVGGLQKSLKKLPSILGVAGGALGAAFAGRALVRGVTTTLDQVDSMAKMSTQLGITVETLQTLKHAAHLSGLELNDLRISFTAMLKNVGLLTAQGKGEAAPFLKKLGLEVADLRGQNPEDLFWKIGTAIASIESPAERVAVSQKFFEESGQKLLTLFKGSPADIAAFRDSIQGLGGFSTATAQKIEALNDRIYISSVYFNSLRTQIVATLAPSLMWLFGRLIHVGQAFSKLTKSSNILQAALGASGIVGFVALLGRIFSGIGGIRGALTALGRILLPWIAWALILDDIVTFLKGGDSALGRFLDTLFGAGTSRAVLAQLRDDWKKLVEWIKRAAADIKAWASTTDDSTKKAILVVGAFVLAASTGIGQVAIRLSLLSAAWLVQIARVAAAGTAWAAASLQAGALALGINGVALAAGAAAAAVLSVVAAVDQFRKLLDEVGGPEGLFSGLESLAKGKGFFEGVDEAANRKAREKAGVKDPGTGPKTRMQRAAQVAADAKRRAEHRASRQAFGTRAAPEPTLTTSGAGSKNVVLTDQRTVNVNVAGGSTPAATGRAVAGAVTKVQRTDVKQIRGALVGAEHG